MAIAGHDDRIYPVNKLATLVSSLSLEGLAPAEALASAGITEAELESPVTRMSINQVLQCCRNASQFSTDPLFAYRVGSRFHISTYGLYGFAILSSTSLREALRFGLEYHDLAAPLAEFSWLDTPDSFQVIISPIIHRNDDMALYRFLVELHLGIEVSLLRDMMGPNFVPREAHVSYSECLPTADGALPFPVIFDQPCDGLIIDREWLDRQSIFANELTYKQMTEMCQRLLQQMRLNVGFVGQVRAALMARLARPTNLETIADVLNVPGRTLRRRLQEENTSFQQLSNEARMHMGMNYLRQTRLSMEDIARLLGFSDAAGFRHAFKRWTGTTPGDFRSRSSDEIVADVDAAPLEPESDIK